MKEVWKYYKRINEARRVFKPRCFTCRDKEGSLLTDKQEMLERWCQYLEELLSGTGDQYTGGLEAPRPQSRLPQFTSESIIS